jgi:hypothetical protein
VVLVTEALAFAGVVRPGFELTYADGLGREQRARLCESSTAAFEDVGPVRAFPSFKGQRNFPGWWWSATTGRHVGHESWLERDHAMLLDFDPDVVGFASQPFRLHWLDRDRIRGHVPDFFARLADGTGVVIDVRADDRIEAADAEAFAATETACIEAGWAFRRVGELAPVFVANVRWLARYRHPRCAPGDLLDRVLETFLAPTPLLEGAREIGETLTVLPMLFHLLWRQVLVTELATEPLCDSSLITLGRFR